jgi:hypothetical protein
MKENPYNSTKPHNLFVGREELLREVINGFRNGNSFAVLGGRRCGKTSLLLELERRLQNSQTFEAYKVIPRYLDMQSLGQISSEELFEHIYSLVVQEVAAPKWNPSTPGKAYQNFLEHLDCVAESMRSMYGPEWLVVLLIDELDAAIGRLPDDMFFQNNRNLLMVSRFKLHFRLVASGVTNLTALISSGSSPLNNLRKKALGVMSHSEAQQLVRRGFNADLPVDVETEVFRLTGRHPYLLQALFERIDLETSLSGEVLERAVRKYFKETSTFQKWFEGFRDPERSVYSAIANASGGRLPVAQLKSLLDSHVRLQLDDVLETWSFHCVIDDSASDLPEIAGTMFGNWFRDHCLENISPSDSKEVRNIIFISYSHKDKKWLNKLQTMVKPLVQNSTISVWDDTRIKAGARWKEEIEQALEAAKVAILLVSPNFLESDFIAKHELPPLLEATKKQGPIILWVYISTCLYDRTEIEGYQAAHDISKPLDSLTRGKQNAVLADVCRKIEAAVNP